MKFTAIDVETSNADMGSICSIGLATFENGDIVDEWYSLINPEDYFDGINVSIHGINQNMVQGSPNYADISKTILQKLGDTVAVTHSHFDRVALHQASARWNVPEPGCKWLDSARIARRTWAECARSGYGLANVCKLIGYEFQHHHALEDAKASGRVLLAAMEKTGLDLDGWLTRIQQPIDPLNSSSGNAIRRDGNSEGPLFGEVVVFTGALTIPRREAADLAAFHGCSVDPGVTKKTTLLVVGDSDVQRLAGFEKSTKHRKAEDLIAKGFPIRIIRETDFRKLTATSGI